MSYDIFLSYSSKDKVVADAVVSALENQNIRCWYAPRDIKPGADWGSSITEAIHDCKIILLIFSSNSNQSKRVLDEVYFAISEEKTIIPFRIENLDPTGALRLHLSSRHWLDAYHPSWKAHINYLIDSLAVNLGRTATLLEEPVEGLPPVVRTGVVPKKKLPWLWIGLAAGLIIIITGVGIIWNANQTKQLVKTPEIASAELSPTEAEENEPMEATLAEEELVPTDSMSEIPTETPVVVETQKVVLNGYLIDYDAGISLDPQVWIDIPSMTFHENLFLSLTNYDIEKGKIVPEAADSWTISPDGKQYTFRLRSDIPWVLHTPGGDTKQVIDEQGTPRFVTAQDFVDAFRRNCDPRVQTGGLEYSLFGLVKGCQEVYEYADPSNIPQALIEAIGVRALGENELLVELEKPSGYFLSLTSVQTLSAVPLWAIDKYSAAWTNPGNMPTNGYYVIDEWVPGEHIRWLRNPLLPEDLTGRGNVDVIEFALLENDEDAYALWLEGELDYSTIPPDKLLTHRVSYARETTQVFEQLVGYIVFQMQEPPFDNVHLRRAFAAAFDRAAYINGVMEGQGLMMKHLAPPVVFGAPPIDEVGVGYDVEYALAELTAAGYPNCQGMPEVTFWLTPTRDKPEIRDIVRTWEEKLNCPEGTITIVPDIVAGLDMWFVGWLSDYADEHDWVGTVLSCENNPTFLVRSCNEIDYLIEQAAQETNNEKRIELYAQIEEAFFGEEGDFPLIPVRWVAYYTADHTWLERTQSVMGKETYYNWTIDMDSKHAAMEQ